MIVIVDNTTERETISQIWWFKDFSKSLHIKIPALKWKGTNIG